MPQAREDFKEFKLIIKMKEGNNNGSVTEIRIRTINYSRKLVHDLKQF